MVWRHRRMLELFTENPNLYRTRQPESDAAMIRQTKTSTTNQKQLENHSPSSKSCPSQFRQLPTTPAAS